MKIKLYGVRGSLPSPAGNREYRGKIRSILNRAIKAGIDDQSMIDGFISQLPDDLQYFFGGNTTCVTVESRAGKNYILDCGSGLRVLGDEMLSGDCGKGKGHLKIFLTHLHWDHIQGIPFFKPLYIPGNLIEFFSPYKDLHEKLNRQMDAPFFPAPFDSTASSKEFNLIDEGDVLQIEDDLLVDCSYLKHPGGSYAYRFREGGKTFIFATDAEFTGEALEKQGSGTEFFNGADLLIIDSQYTLDEHFNKFEWGHTSYTVAVNCAIRWGVKHLVLTHHDPSNNDNKLQKIHDNAVKHRNYMKENKPAVSLAREGMAFVL